MAETLTACVIARNEEQRLPACLQSLEFCDEVVVVDSGSRDRTREIAREAGARVIENPWRGFAVQRNVALDHASGSWVLEIDADERVGPELAREIRALLESPPTEVRMAAIPMRDVFLGKPL
ncbi:MAG TPA: glycosyltransferase family 2 protein, partial [Solirubrobacterales bacterium]|nr:glycosyltransferase family 2 protein [Solirubrobacterales bacterium]